MILTMLLLFNYDKLRVPILIMTIMFPLKKNGFDPLQALHSNNQTFDCTVGCFPKSHHIMPPVNGHLGFSRKTPNAHVGYHLFLGLSPITLPQMVATKVFPAFGAAQIGSFSDRWWGKQPISKNISQIGSLPQVGVNIFFLSTT